MNRREFILDALVLAGAAAVAPAAAAHAGARPDALPKTFSVSMHGLGHPNLNGRIYHSDVLRSFVGQKLPLFKQSPHLRSGGGVNTLANLVGTAEVTEVTDEKIMARLDMVDTVEAKVAAAQICGLVTFPCMAGTGVLTDDLTVKNFKLDHFFSGPNRPFGWTWCTRRSSQRRTSN